MEYLEKLFRKTGWISIIESIAFAILGVIVVWNPEGTVKAISYIISTVLILIGIVKIINYILAKGKYDFYNNDLIYGLIAIIVGAAFMIFSGAIGSIFRIIIGIWIVYSAFIRMNLAIKLKAQKLNIWVHSLIISLIMFICGLYVMMNPGAIVATIGAIMIAYSIMDIIEEVIFMRNVKEIF